MGYKVVYCQFRAEPRGLVADRDLLLLARLRLEPDGSLVVPLSSTDHIAKPEVPGFVRAHFVCGGYIIRPTPRDKVFQVSFLGAVDLMGWIPSFIMSLIAWKQAE